MRDLTVPVSRVKHGIVTGDIDSLRTPRVVTAGWFRAVIYGCSCGRTCKFVSFVVENFPLAFTDQFLLLVVDVQHTFHSDECYATQ